jgi:iron-sulfur cluster assembly protein
MFCHGHVGNAKKETRRKAVMLTLSPSAVEAVDALLHSPEVPEEAGLRIAATEDTPEPALSVQIAPEPDPEDQVIEEGGARVFVDATAAALLDDAQLEAQAQGDQIAFGIVPRGNLDGNGPG